MKWKISRCRLSHAIDRCEDARLQFAFMGHGCINKSSPIGQSKSDIILAHSRSLAQQVEPFDWPRKSLLENYSNNFGCSLKQVVEIIKINWRRFFKHLVVSISCFLFRRHFCTTREKVHSSLKKFNLERNRRFIFIKLMRGVEFVLIHSTPTKEFRLLALPNLFTLPKFINHIESTPNFWQNLLRDLCCVVLIISLLLMKGFYRANAF